MGRASVTYVNRDIRARTAPKLWAEQYPPGHGFGRDKDNTRARLAKLAAPDADTVNRIIGNDSWTSATCDMCSKFCTEWLEICGEYEAMTACLGCADKIAAELARARKP